jgi:hypothetical protein
MGDIIIWCSLGDVFLVQAFVLDDTSLRRIPFIRRFSLWAFLTLYFCLTCDYGIVGMYGMRRYHVGR